MDKQKLLNEFLDLGGNYRLEESKAVEAKMLDYIENYGDEPQINDALRILQMYRVESIHNDLETSCQIVKPIFERLTNTEQWDIYDILLSAIVVGHAETYIQSYMFAEDILKRLEEYSNEKWYAGTKLIIHMNTVTRLLRAKHFDSDNVTSSRELENIFLRHANATLALCKGRKYLVHKAMTMVRKGIFYKDDDLTREGFKLLSDNGELEVYRMLQHEVRQFEFFTELTITRKQYDTIIGSSIRELRLDRKMTTEELAELLDVSPWSVNQFERGERGTSGLTIRKLADIFNVSTDALYYGPQIIPFESNHHEKQLQMLLAYARKLTEDETDYLLTNIKSLLKLNRGKKSNHSS